MIGEQCGDRTLGDFLQLRLGPQGEAQISYADSNNADEPFAPHGMYVKQNGGPGLLAGKTVTGDPILFNAASDPAGDAKREANGLTSANAPSLDILFSSLSQPAPSECHPAGSPCYRVKMTVNNLSLAAPFAANLPFYAGDTVAVWLTQWLLPADPKCTSTADSCTTGGKNPFVYFESNGTCWSGENAALLVGGGVTLTYPGKMQITTAGACSFVAGPFGTITIDVPISDVNLDPGVAQLNPCTPDTSLPCRLYSVTASTMTLNVPPESVPANPGNFNIFTGPVGGVLFDLIDVVRAYDFVPGAGGGGGGGCHEGDGDGHIQGEKSSKASFHFDADACEDNVVEQVDANDPSGNMDFHSTRILSIAFDDVAHTITIAGLGTDNGLPVTFAMVAVDSSLVPPGLFSITLSDGYTNSGNLLDGSIMLH